MMTMKRILIAALLLIGTVLAASFTFAGDGPQAGEKKTDCAHKIVAEQAACKAADVDMASCPHATAVEAKGGCLDKVVPANLTEAEKAACTARMNNKKSCASVAVDVTEATEATELATACRVKSVDGSPCCARPVAKNAAAAKATGDQNK